MESIGILHPGEMGVSLAASAQKNGNKVSWASQGRSERTRLRASAHALFDAGSLAGLCRTCSILISVCPPHAAEELAGQVVREGFKGLYVDANAISPGRALRIAETMRPAGIDFVDGGIIGGPAWQPGETCLYLSGRQAESVAACFSRGPLEARVISEEIGNASALKMCYAAYSKGTTALLSAILAAAETLRVRTELMQQWDRDESGFSDRANQRARRVTLKAWRFEGEMREIADTFKSVGLPDGFHQAAADVYHRLAGFRDAGQPPALDAVLAALLVKNSAP